MFQRRATAVFALQSASHISRRGRELESSKVLSPRQFGSSFDEKSSAAVLLVASRQDPAGLNLATALLERGGIAWTPLESGKSRSLDGEVATWAGPASEVTEHGRLVASSTSKCSLWVLEERLTRADHLDERWQDAGGFKPTEIIFLSRHASASGKPCLTVHPIGNPRVGGGGDPAATSAQPARIGSVAEEFGGRVGLLPPPNPRMGSLLRALKKRARAVNLLLDSKSMRSNDEDDGQQEVEKMKKKFDVCPEATHHGPWVESTPCCFVEIGSTDQEWTRQDAAQVWAEVLHDELFGLDSDKNTNSSSSPISPSVVLIGIGGGHYAPKVWDVVASSDRVAMGHIVPSYALNFEDHVVDSNSALSSSQQQQQQEGAKVKAKKEKKPVGGMEGVGEENGGGNGGGWQWSVTEAVRSTRAAYVQPHLAPPRTTTTDSATTSSASSDKKHGDPLADGEGGGGEVPEIVALVDKKAFKKAAHRHQVVALLTSLGVRVALSKAEVLSPRTN